jgi:hypothetical protein
MFYKFEVYSYTHKQNQNHFDFQMASEHFYVVKTYCREKNENRYF